MSKIFNSTTVLILGIIFFLFGVFKAELYEDAQVSGYEVEAVIVDVVEKIDNDPDLPTDYEYEVYVDYSFDGKDFTHIYIGKYPDPQKVGDTIAVTVNPENPGEKMADGGILFLGGVVLIVAAISSKVKKKRAE